jgi:lysophospholipase L1-like esterase
MRTLRSLLAKAGLMFAATAVSLLALEGVLRLADYRYTPLRVQVITKWSEWRYYHAFEDRHFVYDPILIWRPRKGSPFFNEQGYRGKLLPPTKEAGTVRIFAIGDSNTLGWPGDGAPQWPMYLEQLLNQHGRRATVTNAGVYGYTSFQGLRRFKEALSFDPDVVLVSFGCNDAMRVTMSDAEFAGRGIRRNKWDEALLTTRVGQVLLAVLDKLPGRKKETLVPRVSIEEYKANLDEVIRISRARNIEIVLLTRPFTGPSPSPWWWKNFAGDYNDATLEMGSRSDVPVIDVYSHFKGCNDCFVDESHFTEKGMRQMAELIYISLAGEAMALSKKRSIQ